MENLHKILDLTASRVLDVLQSKGINILSKDTVNSPRAVGDAVQSFLGGEEGLKICFPKGFLDKFESGFERRSMEDMAFYSGNNYFAVDCKTHNLETSFNMPNLISVQRLANFYKNDANTFCILIIEYRTNDTEIQYKNCYFKPIEAFKWDCLTLGALGWGQIQIANANKLLFSKIVNRKEWMLTLCDRIDAFYCEEIGKIGERRQWFEDVKNYWKNK